MWNSEFVLRAKTQNNLTIGKIKAIDDSIARQSPKNLMPFG